MEEFKDFAKKLLGIGEVDIRLYSPLALAYIGDAVYDLIIRTKIVCDGNAPVNSLHKGATHYVSATAQADMMKLIEGSLTEEEHLYYKRGRNAKPQTTAKNASFGEYRIATGFECLIGYLYLTENFERIIEVVKLGIVKMGEKDEYSK
ncbi:MAG: mrnC [Clostridiales bacterium]|jgi:ribonuclease-3 family protein|nr:mrnC [Clostridiales bacterium]